MQDRRNDMFVSKKFGIGIGQNFGLFAQCIDIQIVKKLLKMFSSNSKITLTILYNSCFQNYHKKYEVLASFAQCIDIQIVKKMSKMFSSNSKISLTILYNSCFQNYHKKYEVLASLSRISVCAFRISLEQTL